jgi:methylphosphotriester-DNA--protein-cysteine methyltransferase
VPGVRYPAPACQRCRPDRPPDDQDAATEVEKWLQAYATSRDPVLRERIILAHLDLADRLAARYRHAAGPPPRTWSRPPERG